MRFEIRDLYAASATPPQIVELMGVLSELSPVKSDWMQIHNTLHARERDGIRTFVAVEVESGIIVGTASLLFERKLIRGCGLVGRIEDVVVYSKFQGWGIGTDLVKHCKAVAQSAGCYKVLLQCSKDNQSFYEQAGFREYEINMRWDP